MSNLRKRIAKRCKAVIIRERTGRLRAAFVDRCTHADLRKWWNQRCNTIARMARCSGHRLAPDGSLRCEECGSSAKDIMVLR